MAYFYHIKGINFIIFSQTEVSIGYENFVVVSHTSRLNVKVHECH